MNQSRGILYLADPAGGTAQMHMDHVQTLIFTENERYLSQAQQALWRARMQFEWVCVAADGAADLALCLAAQLSVDRIALRGDFAARRKLPRELARLKTFARRNLALVAAEVLLIGAGEEEVRTILRGMGHRRVCALEDMRWDACAPLLTAPWERLCENNLLIPGKCV